MAFRNGALKGDGISYPRLGRGHELGEAMRAIVSPRNLHAGQGSTQHILELWPDRYGRHMSLTDQICHKAHEIGFDLVGVAPARPTPRLDAYHAWLAHGYYGEMSYLARPDRVERREDPTKIVPGARSIVCVALNYYPDMRSVNLPHDPSHGLISKYAWGVDYHDLMLCRLEELASFICDQAGSSRSEPSPGESKGHTVNYRVYVDTGPVLERAYAAEAGLGFIGKNTCLIHPKLGSWLFLGEILLDLELAPTAGNVNASCGTCTRCLDACPTGALVAPYILDARRCISYLTIELKGAIPPGLRPLIGNRIYGCDICQDICPWQRFAKPTVKLPLQAQDANQLAPDLIDLSEMSEEAFRQQYGQTPLSRAKRRGLLRNAAVALGNSGDERAISALVKALEDIEPLVRGHAAWALGHIGGSAARKALKNAWQHETDPYVRHEIWAAMTTP
jgi:epoxyqueuosine reductase